MIQYDDAVRDAHDQLHVVLHQDDGDTFVTDLLDQGHEVVDLSWVQACGRFVEQQEAGPRGQCYA